MKVLKLLYSLYFLIFGSSTVITVIGLPIFMFLLLEDAVYFLPAEIAYVLIALFSIFGAKKCESYFERKVADIEKANDN